MANIIDVVPPQYAPPISAPQLPVGGVVDPNTGNPSAQVTDLKAAPRQEETNRLLGNILVELQLLNENLFPRVNFEAERKGRYS